MNQMNKINCHKITQFYIQSSYFSHVNDSFSPVFISSFGPNAYVRVRPLSTLSNLNLHQAFAYKKQRRATIARLVTKFRDYRRVKSREPPTK